MTTRLLAPTLTAALVAGLAGGAATAATPDPPTGNRYLLRAGGELVALARDERVLWQRSLGDDFGLDAGPWSTPLVEGGLVIVGGVGAGWGEQARAGYRLLAFDKTNGELAWSASPAAPPSEGPPAISERDGQRLLVLGEGAGAGHGLAPETGEAVPLGRAAPRGPAPGEPAFLQVRPAEVTLRGGETARFHARLYDARGRFLREEPGASWSLDQLRGELKPGGELAVAEGPRIQAGRLEATAGGLTGTARVRVFPSPPLFVSFDWLDKPPAAWIGAAGLELRDEAGGKRLLKPAGDAARHARVLVGPSDMHDYAVAADVLPSRAEGDAGLVAQGCTLVLSGGEQKLELAASQPGALQAARAPLAWRPGTWYRLKLRVENQAEGAVRARGKAWPSTEPEPDAWMVERTDPGGARQGSPGIRADAPGEVLFDNLSVVPNDARLAAGRRDPGLFAYDSSLPPDLQQAGTETRGGVPVRDVSYASLGGGRTAAYLVDGQGPSPHPAVLFVHWYEPGSPTSNRTQFLDEAVELGALGVTSLLVATPWSDPAWFGKRDAERDYEMSVAEVKELRRALDVLLAQPGVDASRVAYVGHDFGAMYGAVLAGVDRRVQSFALQAGTGSFPDWFLYAPPRLGEARRAFIERMAVLEPAAYTAAAAPAEVFFQFGTSDPHVFRERADAFYAMASRPKRIAFYEAGHALDDAARKDRVAWLRERLKLRQD